VGAQSICGTASDAFAGVHDVKLSVKDVTTNKFWNGTTFNSATEVFFTATGTTSWSFPFPASRLTSGDSFTIHAVASDNALNANVANDSNAGILFDTTPPTGSITAPANGAFVGPAGTP